MSEKRPVYTATPPVYLVRHQCPKGFNWGNGEAQLFFRQDAVYCGACRSGITVPEVPERQAEAWSVEPMPQEYVHDCVHDGHVPEETHHVPPGVPPYLAHDCARCVFCGALACEVE